MTTAFVLSGGGSLGAVQVGMLQALEEHHIRPDLVIGTSVGAVNSAYLGAFGWDRRALARLADLWSGLSRGEVFPVRVRHQLGAVVGRAPALFPQDALRRLLERHLADATLEGGPLPVHAVACDLLTGLEVLLSRGSSVEAALASSAIPAVLPPVTIDDRTLVDGGLADHAAISQAVRLGADRVYVLPAGHACALAHPPRTALTTALHALTLLIQQRLWRDVGHFKGRADIRLLPPLCPVSVAPTDFRQGAALIARAREASDDWIEHGGTRLPDPERFLALHSHRPPAVASGQGGGLSSEEAQAQG